MAPIILVALLLLLLWVMSGGDHIVERIDVSNFGPLEDPPKSP